MFKILSFLYKYINYVVFDTVNHMLLLELLNIDTPS